MLSTHATAATMRGWTSLDILLLLYYNRFMAITPRKYRKDVIVVRLADGHKILVKRKAKQDGMRFSEAIRQAIQSWLGL